MEVRKSSPQEMEDSDEGEEAMDLASHSTLQQEMSKNHKCVGGCVLLAF
jgi:hypothetical protein